MQASGFEPVASYNPYWSERGVTCEDADGYRVTTNSLGAVVEA